MKKRIALLAAIAFFMMFMLTGCFPNAVYDPYVNAGFFAGIWHGIIAPISLIGSLFNSDISIFEVNNRGFWYNLGFYLAIAGEAVSGGSLISIRVGKKRRR